MQQIKFSVRGMLNPSSAQRIENALLNEKAINEARVNFVTETVIVHFDERKISHPVIADVIKSEGFECEEFLDIAERVDESDSLPPHLLQCAILSASCVFALGLPNILQFVVATIAIGLVYKSYWTTITAFNRGILDYNLPTTLGILLLYFSSVISFFSGSASHHFISVMFTLTFIHWGKYAENILKHRHFDILSQHFKNRPRTVIRKNKHQEEVIPTEKISVGDILVARAGDYLFADGAVVSGRGWSNQSIITGEMNAQLQDPEMPVLAASILTDGYIEYRAERIGNDTIFNKLLASLDIAQNSKSDSVDKNDKFAAALGLGFLITALVTFLFTGIFSNFQQASINTSALLIAASPTALALAALLNIQNGFIQAVRAGVWFRDAFALEEAGAVKVVAMDKTGTLTVGKPKISGVWSVGVTENKLLQIAASLERYTKHPVAEAIVAANPEKHFLETSNVHFFEGGGVAAHIAHKELRVGSFSFTGVELPPQQQKAWQTFSIISLSVGQKALGAIALQDAVRADAIEAVNEMYKLGVNVLLLSGDNQSAVEHIAHSLHIKNFYAELTQVSKREIIKRNQSYSSKVAVITSDNHNAPMLETADVGILIDEQSKMSNQNIEAQLIRPSILSAVATLKIARETLNKIKQQSQLSIGYNVAVILLAILGLLSPLAAGAISSLASLAIVWLVAPIAKKSAF